MEALFADHPEALDNTVKIAEQCQLDFTFGVTKLPFYKAPTDEDNVTYFKRMCYEGWCAITASTPKSRSVTGWNMSWV